MFTRRHGHQKATVALAIGAIAILAAACSSSSTTSTTTTGAPSTTATTPALPTTVIPTQPTNAAIAATVPAAVKSKGSISTSPWTPPTRRTSSSPPNGSTIVGMDADLATAITQVLGLKPKLINVTFDTIIPGIQSGKYGMGASSFTDTIARQKVVDFVDYFTAGEGFYVKAGSPLAFNGLTSLCGHSVAVESGTTEQSDAQAQAKKCASGKVTVLSFGNQSEANLAVSSGRADVGFADSQVAGYIVATSNGVFQNSGTAFEVAPYGLALPKGNGMAAPVQAAVNYLIGNGVYNQILTKWGVQSGAVTSSVINGATS